MNLFKKGSSIIFTAAAVTIVLALASCAGRGPGISSTVSRGLLSSTGSRSSSIASRPDSSAVSSLQSSSSLAESQVSSSEAASSYAAGAGSSKQNNGGTPTHTTPPAAPTTPAAPSWPDGGTVPSAVQIPSLDGSNVAENDQVSVDLSYASYGFVKVRMKTPSAQRMKVMISLGGGTYTYDLNSSGGTEIYPMQMGSGSYTISVWQNISGSSYAQIYSTGADVALSSSTIPFLVPNQMVNYTQGSSAASIARQLVSGKSNNFERISAVLTYVASNISYDYNLAATVQSGYIPNVDSVLARRKGICFDYAAVTAAMLRSLGYPTKLITGYVSPNNTYHAWNEVYFNSVGWVKVMDVQVTANGWSRIDTTFISTAKSSSSIAAYVGNGSNYTKKLTY